MNQIYHLSELLPTQKYWGRGIIVGLTPDGTQAVVAYFLEGRSENSRNRVLVNKQQEGIVIEPFDPEKVEDPSLIIYKPLRTYGKSMIITNGDQTETIYDFLTRGDSFDAALETRTYEPDAPNFTPRISAIIDFNAGYSYKMNIIRASAPDGGEPIRNTFEFKAHEGLSHFIHTYKGEGDPLPAFDGEPEILHTYNNIDLFTEYLWSYLDDNNKVSLFVRYIDVHSLDIQTRILNKNQRVNNE